MPNYYNHVNAGRPKGRTNKPKTEGVLAKKKEALNTITERILTEPMSKVREETIDFRSDEWRGANTASVIEDKLALVPIKKKLIILEDRFRSGYECPECEGTGASKEVCPLCKGTKVENAGSESDTFCRACTIGQSDGRVTLGFKFCSNCNGIGTKGGLIFAEQSERRPTSGKVLAAGPLVEYFKVGDHVLYGNYAGYAISFKQKSTIRIMDEDEVMALMYLAKFNMSEAKVI